MTRRGERAEEGASQDQEVEAGALSMAAVLAILREERQAEREERQAERQEQHAQQQMMMALVEQQREELARCREQMAAQKEAREGETPSVKVKLPKPTLQKLAPGDDIEHFLSTFERIARQQGWPDEVWATQLAGLLTGKAMAAYAALSTEDAGSYERAKAAVLRRYEINEETHRIRFRQDRKKTGESHREWMDRLKDHFSRWTKEQTMPVTEVVILEQFLQCVPEDLRVWLRERKPESLAQAAELADDFVLARKGEGRLPPRKGPWTGPVTDGARPEQGKGSYTPRSSERLGPSTHFQEGRPRTNASGDKRCYQCGKYGHFFYHCPTRTGSSVTATSKALFGSTCDEVAWNEDSQKLLCRGRIEGQAAKMLVDTGCDMTMVSAEWVDPSKMNPEETVSVLCVHGDTMEYPTASLKIQVGKTERVTKVAVAPRLPVPVLLGRDVCDMQAELEGKKQSHLVVTRAQTRNQERQIAATPEDAPRPENQAAAMQKGETLTDDLSRQEEVSEPRGEAQQAGRPATGGDLEHLPSALEASPEQLKKWQNEDSTLAGVRNMAQQDSGEDDRVSFFYRDGILYRWWRPQERR